MSMTLINRFLSHLLRWRFWSLRHTQSRILPLLLTKSLYIGFRTHVYLWHYLLLYHNCVPMNRKKGNHAIISRLAGHSKIELWLLHKKDGFFLHNLFILGPKVQKSHAVLTDHCQIYGLPLTSHVISAQNWEAQIWCNQISLISLFWCVLTDYKPCSLIGKHLSQQIESQWKSLLGITCTVDRGCLSQCMVLYF